MLKSEEEANRIRREISEKADETGPLHRAVRGAYEMM
jgi:hypothetical protein